MKEIKNLSRNQHNAQPCDGLDTFYVGVGIIFLK